MTFFDNKPLNITNTFPVNNSAPVKITMDKPNGRPIAPFKKLHKPAFVCANEADCAPTCVSNKPPKPINAPAVIPNAKVCLGNIFAFFSEVAKAVSNVSCGVFASCALINSFDDLVLFELLLVFLVRVLRS